MTGTEASFPAAKATEVTGDEVLEGKVGEDEVGEDNPAGVGPAGAAVAFGGIEAEDFLSAEVDGSVAATADGVESPRLELPRPSLVVAIALGDCASGLGFGGRFGVEVENGALS
jgi:hypothetical protein